MKTTTLLSLSLGLMFGAPALAQTYTISQTTIGSSIGAGCTGGTFTPNVDITPTPSPAPSTIPLQQVTFYRGTLGANNPNAATYLNIYDGQPGAGGTFIGTSTNSVDTTVATFDAPYVWDFGGLSINYTQKYWLVMSDSNTGVGATAIGVSLYGAGANVYLGGEALQAGYASQPAGNDLKFVVLLGTPEPKIDQLTHDNNAIGPGGTGQTFTPNVGILPVPSPAPSTIPLRQVTFFRGTLGANNPNAATYLNVYDGQPGAGGTFIGSSTNTVDTTVAVGLTPFVWDFADLPLNYTQQYWLVMSDSSTGVGATAIGVSLYTNRTNPYSGGDVLKAGYVPNPPADLMFSIVFSPVTSTDGTFTYTPGGCPNSAGQPVISSTTAPNIGTVFTANVAPVPVTAAVFMVYSTNDTYWTPFGPVAGQFPFQVSAVVPWVNPACNLYVDPVYSLFLGAGAPSASWNYGIANLGWLVGLKIHMQAITLETSPNRASFSGKGTITIGQ